MSEVDRLSNSGLYPAIPLADRQRKKHESGGNLPQDPGTDHSDPNESESLAGAPRPPKSLIDEYA